MRLALGKFRSAREERLEVWTILFSWNAFALVLVLGSKKGLREWKGEAQCQTMCIAGICARWAGHGGIWLIRSDKMTSLHSLKRPARERGGKERGEVMLSCDQKVDNICILWYYAD